jgi:hypothetical protein
VAGTLQLLRSMYVLRSIVAAMVPGCVWMMLMLSDRSGTVHLVVMQPTLVTAPAPLEPPGRIDNPVSILDLATADRPWDVRQIVAMVPLAPGEQIVAINDHAITQTGCSAAAENCVAHELATGALAGVEMPVTARSFVDFTIARAASSRRVLVVVH